MSLHLLPLHLSLSEHLWNASWYACWHQRKRIGRVAWRGVWVLRYCWAHQLFAIRLTGFTFFWPCRAHGHLIHHTTVVCEAIVIHICIRMKLMLSLSHRVHLVARIWTLRCCRELVTATCAHSWTDINGTDRILSCVHKLAWTSTVIAHRLSMLHHELPLLWVIWRTTFRSNLLLWADRTCLRGTD